MKNYFPDDQIKQEMLEALISFVQTGAQRYRENGVVKSKPTYREDVKLLIEKITGKSIKEILNDFLRNNVMEIIIKYLKDNGFDGLYLPGKCGCDLDSLQCCGEDFSECEPWEIISGHGYYIRKPV